MIFFCSCCELNKLRWSVQVVLETRHDDVNCSPLQAHGSQLVLESTAF